MPTEARAGHTTIFFDAETRALGDVAAALASGIGLPFVRDAGEPPCFVAVEGDLRLTLRRRASPVPAPAHRLDHELDVEGRDDDARLRLARHAWRLLRGLGLRMRLVNEPSQARGMTAAERDAAIADLIANADAHAAKCRAQMREEHPSMTDEQIENNVRAAFALLGL